MALSLQLGFPDVPKSITNLNVNIKDALDVGYPMPFLTFIKIINVSFEPDSLQNYYNFYLKSWNNQNKNKNITQSDLIVQKYKEFLKEITLNYTTLEEKNFLSKINFDDPFDLDIAIGFYSRKLKEVSLHHNSKRNDIKFNTIRNKLRGTNFGTEKTIFELTLSYLKSLDDGKILYDYDQIKSDIEIEIEELYDTYPSYFNKTPDASLYDAKDLDYGYDIFLKTNSELISSVFKDMSSDMVNIKEINSLLDNKRILTEKYISTDFYYLSTGSTINDFLSGKLFSADKPSSNFLNRDYPTSNSNEHKEYLKTPREKGFFRPLNTSIVLVDGRNSSFSFNFDNLKPNSLYYFPDPSIIGENGGVITFIVDDDFLKRNFTSGNAINQPNSSPNDSKYFGYKSKIEPNKNKNLDLIFDTGIFKDYKKDIYNNLFGLISYNKNSDKKYTQQLTNIDNVDRVDILINGYVFYDTIFNTGYTFNYSTPLTSGQTINTGITTNTGDFSNTIVDFTFFFGNFTPYTEFIQPTDPNLVQTVDIIDGSFFTNSNGTFYGDLKSSDLYNYTSTFLNNSSSFYYTDLIEGGVTIGLSGHYERALLDYTYSSLTSSFTYLQLSATFLANTRTIYDNANIIDGGEFYETINFDINSNVLYYYQEFYDLFHPPTISTTLSTTKLLNIVPISELTGGIYVRNVDTKEVQTFITAFPHISTLYTSDIVSDLINNVLKFEISNDIIIIETLSSLTINKILFGNSEFQDPKTIPLFVNHSTGNFDKISNRFKKDNMIYYSRLQRGTDTSYSNDFIIYPEIYQIDLINFTNKLIFPINPSDITSFFSISGDNVRYMKSDSPVLTYNSRNNIFNVSFLIKDQNNMFALEEYDFELNPDVNFLSHNKVNTRNNVNSNIFNISNLTSNLNIYLSGGTVNIQNEELIL